jgi:hypothetical protein
VVPGFDQPRVSARWNWVLVIALIVLAGAGIDRLRTRTSRDGGLAVLAAGLGVVAAMLLGAEHAGLRNSLLWLAIVTAVVVLALVPRRRVRAGAAGLLVVLAVAELAMPMARLIDQGSADVTDTAELIGPTERWLAGQPGLTLELINGDADSRYLVGGLRPNANTLSAVRSIDGYDGGVSISRRWHAALLQIIPTMNEFVFGAQLPVSLDPAAFARLGVHFVLYDPARGPAAVNLPGWLQQPTTGYFQVYANPLWHGEVTAWYATRQVDTAEAAGNLLRTERALYREIGLVESAEAVLGCSGSCPPASFAATSSAPGERSATVQLAGTAVVAFDEQYDTGWTATVDGEAATVLPVDGVWAAVVVPAGEHRIELRYSPGWLYPSLAVMVLAWLGAAALCWWPELRRRTSDRREDRLSHRGD